MRMCDCGSWTLTVELGASAVLQTDRQQQETHHDACASTRRSRQRITTAYSSTTSSNSDHQSNHLLDVNKAALLWTSDPRHVVGVHGIRAHQERRVQPRDTFERRFPKWPRGSVRRDNNTHRRKSGMCTSYCELIDTLLSWGNKISLNFTLLLFGTDAPESQPTTVRPFRRGSLPLL